MFSWKDALISLSIAAGTAVVIAVGATYYFNHALVHMTGSGVITIGRIAAKLFS